MHKGYLLSAITVFQGFLQPLSLKELKLLEVYPNLKVVIVKPSDFDANIAILYADTM